VPSASGGCDHVAPTMLRQTADALEAVLSWQFSFGLLSRLPSNGPWQAARALAFSALGAGFVSRIWQGRQDSNPRPAVLETAALPTELRPYLFGRQACAM
jgi:hypothetical protein